MAHKLLQNQKSFTKTKSLEAHKSSLEPSSTADVEIFTAHRLLKNQKSLTKIKSLLTQKS
jgi:predicted house-cleaning NTP pyrophosphatase (Maf/HAM1 superfamily)